MRWTCCLTVMILGSALSSAVAQAGCGCRGTGVGPDYAALGADACCLPGYSLAPAAATASGIAATTLGQATVPIGRRLRHFGAGLARTRSSRHAACGVPDSGYASQGDVQVLRPTPAVPATPAVPPPPTVPENFRSSRHGNLPMQQ